MQWIDPAPLFSSLRSTRKHLHACLLHHFRRFLILPQWHDYTPRLQRQRVSIAECLGKQADIYLIDEPSAYLDSSQRMVASKTIRRAIEKLGRSAVVVDHDVYMINLISDSIIVFSGTPSETGFTKGPMEMREGMNSFLKDVQITFRRDQDSGRPRINKKDSRLDREQKAKGEYYYG